MIEGGMYKQVVCGESIK